MSDLRTLKELNPHGLDEETKEFRLGLNATVIELYNGRLRAEAEMYCWLNEEGYL